MVPGITHGGSRKNLLGNNPTKELEDAYSLERRVSPRSPQAFIVLSADDGAVPPMNSIGYFLALNQQKVPVSMHISPLADMAGASAITSLTNASGQKNWRSGCVTG